RRAEADIGRLEHGGGGPAGEGGGEHLALEPDVEHARALRIETGEGGEDQRHRDPDRRLQDDDERIEIFHLSYSAGAGFVAALSPRPAKNAVIAGLNMFSSAPANRMTRPWMMTIMSREICGI